MEPLMFQLHYNFDRTNLLREPLIAVVAFYLLFLVVIAFMRFDFSITSVSLHAIFIHAWIV